jgi:hypothetical protein
MSMKPSALMERLIAGITLTIAFLVMASVFVPDQSQAGHDASQHQGTAGPESDDSAAEAAAPPGAAAESATFSTDPHAGLRSLGSLESSRYLVEIYSTELGPRYSVYERTSGKELAVLMDPEKIARHFPDLPLPAMDFSGPTHLMLLDQADTGAP